MLHIVTDSAADMPLEWRQKYNVQFVPVNIHFGTEQFLHGVDITEEQYYKRLETVTDKTFPKTSQPNPHQFEQAYRKVAKKGDTILSVHVTGKLSKTIEAAQAAALAVKDDFNVVVFDSLSGSAAMGYMCREAREMEQAGKSMPEILTRLEKMRSDSSFVVSLATLKYAQMSGRVGGLRAMLGIMLHMQPVIELQDGLLLPTQDKIRVRSKALECLVDRTKQRIGDKPAYVSVVHASAPEDAKALMGLVQKALNCKEPVQLQPLSIAIAIQLGPGTVGVLAVPAA